MFKCKKQNFWILAVGISGIAFSFVLKIASQEQLAFLNNFLKNLVSFFQLFGCTLVSYFLASKHEKYWKSKKRCEKLRKMLLWIAGITFAISFVSLMLLFNHPQWSWCAETLLSVVISYLIIVYDYVDPPKKAKKRNTCRKNYGRSA